ncbi:MAG: class I adenylate-forming enzyme family protein [Bacteroidota bacterium]|nr:acyl--CoA ligase [Candidatus Kapabacteria bacterium]MDW8219514.1 class I adenylate-forming enzyme family protein [Bacteroidota bacterium]
MRLQDNIRLAQTTHGIPPENFPVSSCSFAQLIAQREHLSTDKTFLIYYDELNRRVEYSYHAFIAEVRRTAAFMLSLGLQRGDRIATAAHNHPDTIVQYFAAWLADLCVVPLNMSEDNERLRYILTNSCAKVVFCREDYRERITAIVPHTIRIFTVFDDRTTPGGLHTCTHSMTPYTPQHYVSRLDDECLIVYTSGTTGHPKGVVLVQRNILADSEAIARWHHLGEQSRLMCVLPVHHVNGTIVTHTTPFLVGASTVLNRKFQTERFFERIAAENVHIVSVVPTLLAFLLDAAQSSTPTVPQSLRYVICGAGPLTCSLAQRFEEQFGIRIIHGYGLSETTCYSCYLPIDLSADDHRHWMYDYGFPSIGGPLPVNEMAIHDEHGNALGAMQRGEIVIRGANVMKEYYNNPSANEHTFAHGWFRSGDEGFFAPDATGRPYFFITGRLKELIIRGGVNLAPLEIDEVLARAPGVKAGICVGFENDFYGEEVGALVIPESFELATEATKTAILEYCYRHMPFHKAPKVVVFTDSLPTTTTGKYQRNRVKHLFAAWKTTQFRKED